MFERFTDRARRVLVLAQEQAVELGHFIGTDHVLLALALEGDGVAARALRAEGLIPERLKQLLLDHRPARVTVPPADALRSLGIDVDAMKESIESSFGEGSLRVPDPQQPPFTDLAKRMLERSLREALALGHNYIGTEHILLGMLTADDEDDAALQVLAASGVATDQLRDQTLAVMTLGSAAVHDEVIGPLFERLARLRASALRLPADHRHAASIAIGAAVDPVITRSYDDAAAGGVTSGAALRPHFVKVGEAIDAARAALAELGVLDFIDRVPSIEANPTVEAALRVQGGVPEAVRSARMADMTAIMRAGGEMRAAIAGGFERIFHGEAIDAAFAPTIAELDRIRLDLTARGVVVEWE